MSGELKTWMEELRESLERKYYSSLEEVESAASRSAMAMAAMALPLWHYGTMICGNMAWLWLQSLLLWCFGAECMPWVLGVASSDW